MTTDIISWHPLLTDHQAYTLQALGDIQHIQLAINVTRTQDEIRKAQGWALTSLPRLNVQLLPDKRWLPYVIRQLRAQRNAVHLFNSPFEDPKLIFILFIAVIMGLKVYLVSEPYSPIAIGYLQEGKSIVNKFKSWLRPLVYSMYGFFLKKRIDGVFAISPLAANQYKAIGVGDENIFPFGYFVPMDSATSRTNILTSSTSLKCRIIFVGNLISRKGLDLLIDAAKKLHTTGASFQVDVYGHGNADLFDFDDTYIKYAGTIPFGKAQLTIANYDLLVLPSRYDGWGVVVNEAILAGVPVVCSDSVGAGAIVKKWKCGIVYPDTEKNALYDALNLIINNPQHLKEMANMALSSRDTLAPVVAANYMAEVFNVCKLGSLKPTNPWY